MYGLEEHIETPYRDMSRPQRQQPYTTPPSNTTTIAEKPKYQLNIGLRTGIVREGKRASSFLDHVHLKEQYHYDEPVL